MLRKQAGVHTQPWVCKRETNRVAQVEPPTQDVKYQCLQDGATNGSLSTVNSFLANVRSLANKMNELLLLSRKNTDFYRSGILCFTETWLGEHIPASSLHPPSCHLLHDDCTKLSGKTRGGEICFYVNKGWCTDVTVLKKSCSPHIETLFKNCKLFHSPWEFSFILAGVYIPPQACVREARDTWLTRRGAKLSINN